jgi:L-ascorbate 6-phosphate lactonase
MSARLSLQQMRDFRVPAGSMTIWWIGQAGYFLKSPGGVLIAIDPYLSNSCQSDAEKMGLDANRLVPIPFPPAELVGIDLFVLTHSHLDHMDPDTIGPYLAAGGNGPFLAPAETWQRLQERFDIATDRITMTWPNKSYAIGDLTITATFAIGFGADDMTHVGYFVRCQGGPAFYFTGDTAYEDLVAIGVRDQHPDVMIAVINGGFRNMSSAEAAKLAKEVNPKIVIPSHYDLFHCNSAPPQVLRTNLTILGIGEKYRELEHFEPWTYPRPV